MRKPVLYALIAVIALLLISTIVLLQKYQKTSRDYADMKVAEETARASYDEAFRAVTDIQDSLNAISFGDTTVRLLNQELQGEQKLTEPRRRQALERIALLDASIQRNKQKIGELEARLRKSGIRVAGLEKAIAGLKADVAAKEEAIGQLTSRVDSLRTQVTGLQTTVQQDQETIRLRDQTIEEKRREQATIYYIVSDKKDLLKKGILLTKGGLLGIGKTLTLSGRYDESQFTPLDTDQESVIHTQAAKVQILSPQPVTSYELKLAGNWMDLQILDPQQFRKAKHLVIMTK